MDFSRKSKHPYGESTGFFLRVGGENPTKHSLACHAESDFYSSERMKVARKNYRVKQAAMKKVGGWGEVAPCVSLKRKAGGEIEVPAKNVKKAKKKQEGENTQGVNMLKSSDGVEYSLPSLSGAVNVTDEGDVINEIEEMFAEIDVMIARIDVNDEIATNTEELATVSAVTSSEVEAAESSNRVKRTKTVVPGKGVRTALQIVHKDSKISNEELTVAIIEWTLKKIASRKEGKK